MLNKIFLMGRIVRNPELRRTGSGVAVTSFTIAVDDDFKDNDGNKKTIFVDCIAWRGLAETVEKYFAKGRMAVVVGKLDIREWTDKEGNKRRTAEVVADNVYFGDSKKDESNGGYTAPTYSADPTPASDFALLDGDADATLPF